MSKTPDMESAPTLAGKGGGENELQNCTVDPRWRLMDADSAMVVLGIGARMLTQLTTCDAIPSLKIGRLRRYRADWLEAWLDAGCPQTPGSATRVVRDLQRRGGGR